MVRVVSMSMGMIKEQATATPVTAVEVANLPVTWARGRIVGAQERPKKVRGCTREANGGLSHGSGCKLTTTVMWKLTSGFVASIVCVVLSKLQPLNGLALGHKPRRATWRGV